MNKKPTKTRPGTVLLAIVLLAGILLLAYGHFQNNDLLFYAGLIITAAGVINGTVRLAIGGNSKPGTA